MLNSLVRITPPDEPILSIEQARAQCRVDAWGSPAVHPDDELLESYVQAATDELDGVDGWLNRALVTQTWQLSLDYFPERVIRVPLPPLQSVTQIEYDAPDGTPTVLDTDAYDVVIAADPGFIIPATSLSWPSTLDREAAVRIRYVAGYGDAEDVPEIIKNYIRQRVGQSYDVRELSVQRVGLIQPTPFMRDNLESIRMRGVYP
jgi:uncharacterized phiE125 gp8 family phage protein